MPTYNQSALTSLSPRDRRFFQLHAAGPSTSVPFDCIHHAFEHYASLTPYATAVEHASVGQSISYADLDRSANRLANRLRARGIVPGKRVCILSRRSIVNVIAILAVLKAGGQYVPLDGATVTDSTLEHVLRDSGAALVLCMNEYMHRLTGVPALCLEDVVRDDEASDADATKPEDLSSGGDGIYVIYTSGTTGQPKGVDVVHSGITNFLLQAPGNVGMRPGMRVAQLLNIAFDMGAWELLGAMSNGCTLCLRGNRSAEWSAVLATVDIVISTPSILARHDPAHYPNIRHVITGGEVCPQELADRWSRYTKFNNCCGPTEISIANTVQPHMTGQRVSIGTPVPNTTVYVLDDDCQPCAFGETGSMWVGGRGVSRGYLNLLEKTAERYRRDPFLVDGNMMFNTGDLGRWREDGQLDHLGRADDQVKVKGFRVELDGVSAAMRTSEEVDCAVALLVGSDLFGFITPLSASTPTVRADTAAILPYYAVPTRYIALADFPQTRNGKIDKRALRFLAEEQMAYSTPDSPASSSNSSIFSAPSTPALDSSSSMPSSPALPMTPNLDTQYVFRGAGISIGNSKTVFFEPKQAPALTKLPWRLSSQAKIEP